MKNAFKIKEEQGLARVGVLKTAHGRLETPFFMPVATKGSVKLVSMEELNFMGYRCFISNSFLLSLRPGLGLVKKARGLHQLVNWKHGIFTDSGGFQILSPDFLLRLSEEGFFFEIHLEMKNLFFLLKKQFRFKTPWGVTLQCAWMMCLLLVLRQVV